MMGPPFTEEQAEEIRRKYGILRKLRKPFHKTATDADLGRPDRRLALTFDHNQCGCDGGDDGYTPTKCPYCREREEAGHE